MTCTVQIDAIDDTSFLMKSTNVSSLRVSS